MIRYAIAKPEPLRTEHEAFRDAVLGRPADIVTMRAGPAHGSGCRGGAALGGDRADRQRRPGSGRTAWLTQQVRSRNIDVRSPMPRSTRCPPPRIIAPETRSPLHAPP